MNELQQTVLALTSGQWWIDQQWALANSTEMVRLMNAANEKSERPPKIIEAAAVHFQSGTTTDLKNAPNGSVAVIAIRGPISKYSSWYSTGSKEYVGLLNSIYGDTRFVGSVILIDSPGGMAYGTREVFQAVSNPAKPVISLVDNLAASAGYYYIAGSDAIYTTQPNDIVGSIGTYAVLADFNKYFEKIGLPIYEVYAAQSTEKNLDVRTLFDKKDDTLLKAELTQSNQIFIDDIKAARAGKLNPKAGDPFKGAIYMTDEAKKVGLIDGTSTLADVLAEVSDRFQTSKRKSTSMSLISELKSLLSKHGSQESASEEATLASVTKERDDAQAQVTTLTKERDDAQAQVTTLTKERDDAQAQVTTLTKERDDAQAEVTRLGRQPGEKPTPKASGQKAEGDSGQKTPQQIMNELPHNKAADALFGA